MKIFFRDATGCNWRPLDSFWNEIFCCKFFVNPTNLFLVLRLDSKVIIFQHLQTVCSPSWRLCHTSLLDIPDFSSLEEDFHQWSSSYSSCQSWKIFEWFGVKTNHIVTRTLRNVRFIFARILRFDLKVLFVL